ncbi:MAG TPA: TetR family transcriptional regulator [Frankiaceae bacterium]|jgi:AcrR family transcriptional regulator|nr:TetR family transcriptional regulator [Frankiaceae bacterium]
MSGPAAPSSTDGVGGPGDLAELTEPVVGPAVPARATTASQRARRRRILNAAVSLARQGGYDAVQMREVADLAEVALGTLYRYFPSKVHLLSAAMVRQLESLQEQLVREQPEGADPGERVLAVINRLITALSRDRLVSDALVRAMIVAGADEIDQVNTVNSAIIATAMHGKGAEVTERDFAVSLLIGKVLLTDLIGWLCDRMSIEQVRASLADMVAVTMAGRDALAESVEHRQKRRTDFPA